MTILYIASFEEDEQFISNYPRCSEMWENRVAYRGPLTIRFIETEMIDRDQYRLLLRQKDGSVKWQGSWAPHSPFALNEEDAVQMLRWNNMGWIKSAFIYNQGEEEGLREYNKMKAWGDSRKVVCEQWLSERGIELLKPFWEGGPGRQVWIP